MSPHIFTKGPSGGGGSSFITKVSATFEVVLEELKIKAGGIVNADIKEKSLEGNRFAKETIGAEELQTNSVTAVKIAEGTVTDGKLKEKYALLVGRVGGQVLQGGTETKQKLLLWNNSVDKSGGIEITPTGAVKIYETGEVLGNLQTANAEITVALICPLISGLGELTASGKIAGGSLEATGGGINDKGAINFAAKLPTELTGKRTDNYKPSTGTTGEGANYRLKNKEESVLSGIEANGVSGQILWLLNTSVPALILAHNEQKLLTTTVEGKKEATLASTKELYAGETIKASAAITAATKIETVTSETEIQLTAVAKKSEAATQTYESSSTALNRFLFSTAANIKLEQNHTITLMYDSTTKVWRDIALR